MRAPVPRPDSPRWCQRPSGVTDGLAQQTDLSQAVNGGPVAAARAGRMTVPCAARPTWRKGAPTASPSRRRTCPDSGAFRGNLLDSPRSHSADHARRQKAKKGQPEPPGQNHRPTTGLTGPTGKARETGPANDLIVGSAGNATLAAVSETNATSSVSAQRRPRPQPVRRLRP